jgi:Domain of unknown function (DUF4177)
MTKIVLILGLLAVAPLVLLTAAIDRSGSPVREHWEYRVVDAQAAGPSIQDQQTMLNQLGEQGWELLSDMGGQASNKLVFKRKKQ